MAIPASNVIADRYELRRVVGRGGCGVVFHATDLAKGTPVAVKMLSGVAKNNPQFVERLVREQQALQALAGTHAVGAVDLCRTEDGAVCLVMEWLEGIDMERRLSELARQGSVMQAHELLGVLGPVMDTLEKAHELGIVHRDIKPANVFLLSGGRGVRLLDFGLSRLRSASTLTAADTVMGSPSYISPEAWRGGSKVIQSQADLYAAGVIVYRALAGRAPFEGESLVGTMTLVTEAPRPSLRALRPDLPPPIDTWVELALAIDPARRFQYASAFFEALAAVLQGAPIPKHTLPEHCKRGSPSAPAPSTTADERNNAISAAIAHATKLLKRIASNFSRVPSFGPPAKEADRTAVESDRSGSPPASALAQSNPAIERRLVENPAALELLDDDCLELTDDDFLEDRTAPDAASPDSSEQPAPQRADSEERREQPASKKQAAKKASSKKQPAGKKRPSKKRPSKKKPAAKKRPTQKKPAAKKRSTKKKRAAKKRPTKKSTVKKPTAKRSRSGDD